MNSNNLANYFTEDVQARIKAVSNEEMNESLKKLEQSSYWMPILKYLQSRMGMAKDGLYTLDPFKDQTAIARHQGMLMGLVDLQEMVIMLNSKKENNS